MTDSRSRWLVAILEAKRAALDALSPEDREEARLAQIAARARAAQRKEKSRALAARIFELLYDGRSVFEIAAVVGRAPTSVRQFAKSRGIAISNGAQKVLYGVSVAVDQRDALARMAADCGMTPAEALEDLVAFALNDDAAIARRNPARPQEASRLNVRISCRARSNAIRRTLEPLEKAAAKERETLGKVSPGSDAGRDSRPHRRVRWLSGRSQTLASAPSSRMALSSSSIIITLRIVCP